MPRELVVGETGEEFHFGVGGLRHLRDVLDERRKFLRLGGDGLGEADVALCKNCGACIGKTGVLACHGRQASGLSGQPRTVVCLHSRGRLCSDAFARRRAPFFQRFPEDEVRFLVEFHLHALDDSTHETFVRTSEPAAARAQHPAVDAVRLADVQMQLSLERLRIRTGLRERGDKFLHGRIIRQQRCELACVQFHECGHGGAAQRKKCAAQLDAARGALLELGELRNGIIFRVEQFQQREQVVVVMQHRRGREQKQVLRRVRELERVPGDRRRGQALPRDDAVRLVNHEHVPFAVEQLLVLCKIGVRENFHVVVFET